MKTDMTIFPVKTESCRCSSPVSENLSFELPGYELRSFVQDFEETAAGLVPRVKTRLERSDRIGTILTRMGIGRDRYKIVPGLYCVGKPDSESPVLVTANYKLTFDALRKELSGISAWILVLNTDGVNVWCSAGKGIFSSREVCEKAKSVGLEKLVSHRELILPQLSATGVSAAAVKKGCGFGVIWGPIRAKDLKAFLDAGKKADKFMRQITFSFAERLVLIPVELFLLRKMLGKVLLAIFILSGIGSGIFSFAMAWNRGLTAAAAVFAGIISGAVIVPALLPRIPGIAFSVKGLLTGSVFGLWVLSGAWHRVGGLGAIALMIFETAISSYLAMNFTGSTPFTSPSGVEKEMRKFLPIQAGMVLLALISWIISGFAG